MLLFCRGSKSTAKSAVQTLRCPKPREEPRQVQTSNVDENFEPWQPKYRKPGTGCIYQINDSLWEGKNENSINTQRADRNGQPSKNAVQ